MTNVVNVVESNNVYIGNKNLVDEKEFCVGGLDVPDSNNMLLGMWMNQPELARLAKLIFDNIYESSEIYES